MCILFLYINYVRKKKYIRERGFLEKILHMLNNQKKRDRDLYSNPNLTLERLWVIKNVTKYKI